MPLLIQVLENTWSLLVEMAPYLLSGFFIAGLLHWLIRPSWIEAWLGSPGFKGIRNGCLLGIPLPLCSCSVIPVATSLYQNGASRGATVSFLSSTPQTGVDSILATYSLMGGPFTCVRVVVAFISGIISGSLVERLGKKTEKSPAVEPPETVTGCCGSTVKSDPEEIAPCCSNKENKAGRSFFDGLRYACITLPSDLAGTLITALFIAGLIATLLPPDWLADSALSQGITAFILATLVSLPLYVCATASIPLAYTLVAGGFSPGAALVFLIVGPATNTATVAAVLKLLGHRAALIYVGSLVLVAWLAGWFLNRLPETALLGFHQHVDAHESINIWQHFTAMVLVTLLIGGRILSRIRSSNN